MREEVRRMPRRIVLAEDDPGIRKMTKLRLEHEGFTVLAAADGESALRAVMPGRVDLIVLDVKMPKLDGFQVCARLKANPATAKIPIIIFTASTGQARHLADRCLELGVTNWLQKPFRSSELLEKIHRALDARDAASEGGRDG